GASAARGSLRWFFRQGADLVLLPGVGRVCWPRRPVRGGRPGGTARPGAPLRLRLHGHRRRVPGPAQSRRHPARGAALGAHLHWRRDGPDRYEPTQRHHRRVSRHVPVFPACRRRARQLPPPLDLKALARGRPGTALRGAGRDHAAPAHSLELRSMELLANILISAMIAATPLLIAATGELVAERSGVLNLGVEGMMIVGAIAGFSTVIATKSLMLAL